MDYIEHKVRYCSQASKNAALVAALDSGDHILIDFALAIKPDIVVGGEKLLKYAIEESDIDVIKKLLECPEIADNQQIMDDAVRLNVSFLQKHPAYHDSLEVLLEKGGSKDVALQAISEDEEITPNLDIIKSLISQGAKITVNDRTIGKHQKLIEKLFEIGCGNGIKLTNAALDSFLRTICKDNNQIIVKRIIKEYSNLLSNLIKIVLMGNYPGILKLLHEERVITVVSEEHFREAVRKKHNGRVEYFLKNELHKVTSDDIIAAIRYAGPRTLELFIKKDKEQNPSEADDKMRYAAAIEIACDYNRKENITFLLEKGYQCDFDIAIYNAATKGYQKLVEILLKYATTINSSCFERTIQEISSKGHSQTAQYMMRAYRIYEYKFQ